MFSLFAPKTFKWVCVVVVAVVTIVIIVAMLLWAYIRHCHGTALHGQQHGRYAERGYSISKGCYKPPLSLCVIIIIITIVVRIIIYIIETVDGVVGIRWISNDVGCWWRTMASTWCARIISGSIVNSYHISSSLLLQLKSKYKIWNSNYRLMMLHHEYRCFSVENQDLMMIVDSGTIHSSDHLFKLTSEKKNMFSSDDINCAPTHTSHIEVRLRSSSNNLQILTNWINKTKLFRNQLQACAWSASIPCHVHITHTHVFRCPFLQMKPIAHIRCSDSDGTPTRWCNCPQIVMLIFDISKSYQPLRPTIDPSEDVSVFRAIQLRHFRVRWNARLIHTYHVMSQDTYIAMNTKKWHNITAKKSLK